MKKIALAALAVALTALIPQRTHEGAASASSSIAALAPHADPPNALHARVTFTNASDVRALAPDADGDAVWAATSGGVDRYDATTRARAHFGIESGLDSLDVRAVHAFPFAIVVETAEGRCASANPSARAFRCVAARPPAPNAPTDETFEGAPLVARVAVSDGAFVATRGAGVWFDARGAHARLDAPQSDGSSAKTFVRKVAFYKDREYAGTFDDGLVALDGSGAHAIPTAPMRMVNDVLATKDALFVAANEGFFFSRDGSKFERVDALGRDATGLAAFGAKNGDTTVFVTTTAAVHRVRLRRRAIVEANFWRPAGTRSLQGIAVSDRVAWIASEDRGVIRFDPSSNAPTFTAFDKLAGAKTSWVVALAGDDRGGVFAATLRDGVFHVDARGAMREVRGVPNEWTLDASFARGTLCVGTQSGAACWSDWTKEPSRVLVGLPDARVHDVERLGDRLFVSTEAGLAEADAT